MAATGLLIEPMTDLRTLISQSANLQAWLDEPVNQTVANAADALEFIHLFHFDFENEEGGTNFTGRQTRFCIIGDGPLEIFRAATGSGLPAFDWTTGAKFGFLEEVDAYNETNAVAYMSRVHLIIRDILTLQSSSTHKKIDFINRIMGPDAPLEFTHGSRRGYQTYFMEGQKT